MKDQFMQKELNDNYDFHQQNTLSDKTSTIKFKMHKVTQGDAISLSDKK